MSIGSTNFKHYTLVRHQGRSKHQMSEKKEAVKLRAKTLTSSGDAKPTESEKALLSLKAAERSKLQILFRNAHMIAMDALPFRKFGSLAALAQAQGLDVGQTYRNEKQCREFIHAIAEVERKKLSSQLLKVPFLSVMCDGATDSARREQEIVYVRFCEEGKVNVCLAAVKHLERGDADHVYAAVDEAVQEYSDMSSKEWKAKLVGFASDGASVMMGCKNGVATKLKSDRPKLVTVHCTAHRLELAFKDMTSQVEYYNKLSKLLSDLYDFYYRSPLNRSMLERAAKAADIPFLVPTRVGGTRWVAHVDKALSNIVKAMPAILLHLEQLNNPDGRDKCSGEAKAKAKGFLKIMKEPRFTLTTAFLQDLFRALAKASKTLQESNRGISGAYSTLQELKSQVHRLAQRDGSSLAEARKSLGQAATDRAEAAGFRSDRAKIVNSLTQFVDSRFEDVTGSILTAMNIADFKMWPSKDDPQPVWDEFGEVEVRDICEEYKGILENAGVDLNEAQDEWTGLKLCVKTKAGAGDISNMEWSSLRGRREDYQNILTLIDFILTLPSHSADCERGFSLMKRVKTDWRSHLRSDTLTDLMTVMLHSADISEFDPSTAVNHWLTSGTRSRRPGFQRSSSHSSAADPQPGTSGESGRATESAADPQPGTSGASGRVTESESESESDSEGPVILDSSAESEAW